MWAQRSASSRYAVDQSTREAELLLHAAGEAAGEPLGEWSEIGEAQELREAPLTRRLVESAEVRVETQVVEHREILVQPEALRHVAGLRLPRAALGARRAPEHLDGASRRLHQPGEEANEGRLAGPVGTDQPEDSSRRELGGDAGERLRRAKGLHEAGDARRGCR